jgi:hypothetical protein
MSAWCIDRAPQKIIATLLHRSQATSRTSPHDSDRNILRFAANVRLRGDTSFRRPRRRRRDVASGCTGFSATRSLWRQDRGDSWFASQTSTAGRQNKTKITATVYSHQPPSRIEIHSAINIGSSGTWISASELTVLSGFTPD